MQGKVARKIYCMRGDGEQKCLSWIPSMKQYLWRGRDASKDVCVCAKKKRIEGEGERDELKIPTRKTYKCLEDFVRLWKKIRFSLWVKKWNHVLLPPNSPNAMSKFLWKFLQLVLLMLLFHLLFSVVSLDLLLVFHKSLLEKSILLLYTFLLRLLMMIWSTLSITSLLSSSLGKNAWLVWLETYDVIYEEWLCVYFGGRNHVRSQVEEGDPSLDVLFSRKQSQ